MDVTDNRQKDAVNEKNGDLNDAILQNMNRL
jgi:hypothetical protein